MAFGLIVVLPSVLDLTMGTEESYILNENLANYRAVEFGWSLDVF